ncbi:MAG TPA: bifunctional DNA-formamidopyrimidine glycosylase/DNA-(apurinic or apyrimidinic site) lyase [Polyangiaceae bacterium]|nr:bifunctional DNA-formamidopyrimidine glycosylase/DNA-(apurinic or apyrimidinic site) lyase [Polyangiaceae bacterium]
MPELPEVETVRRQLEPVLLGARIEDVTTSRPNYFFVTPPRTLRARLLGRVVQQLTRHGKYLIAHLDNDTRLLMHLGMTGQFVAKALPKDEHVHMVVHLSKQRCLTLRDVRKFGKVEWIAAGCESERLAKLGPDALSTDPVELMGRLKTRKVAIKTALLDQNIWAGVGNIYADEGLYRARISPLKPASTLRRNQVVTLVTEIQALLGQAIAQGGSTINDYLKPDGELGGFQDFHQVYGKTGLPCPNCGSLIARVVLGGRSTHYCARCQKF